MKTLYTSAKGTVTEDEEKSVITVKRVATRMYDGIPDTYTYTTTYDYKTGLYTSESCTGYYAGYYDKYKNRQTAVEAAIREVGGDR